MGSRLYERVERYADFGVHRTGHATDRPTAEWVASELADAGLRILIDDVPFDQCVIDSALLCDGDPVEHLVVPYEWTGTLDTDQVTLRRFDAGFGGRANPLDEAIAELGEPPLPLLLTTGGADSALRGVNRRIHEGSGLPVVLAAGGEHDRLSRGSLRLRIDAHRRPGVTANVFAATERAANGEPALVLSTPLNGWFQCAGERGTGVAVLLDLVERFADHPLLVVATGGHELDYFGARHWEAQAAAGEGPERTLGVATWLGVVHIGASIAVEQHDAPPPRPLAATRVAMTSIPADRSAAMTTSLARANYQLASDADRWLGEAEVFSAFELPLLSFTGAGHDFHTPHDTPERATSPRGMQLAADAIADAVASFLDHI